MQKTINRLSRELNLPVEVIKKVYKGFWYFIKSSIEEFPLKEELSEEEFNKLRTNFNIPNLGKLVCPYNRYIGVKKRRKYFKKYDKHIED